VLVQFATVFVFLALAIVFVMVALAISWMLRPKKPSPEKQSTYECGEEPEGSPWIRFNVRFYLVALFFIVFDVEIIFMLPWAVAFKQMLGEIGSFAFFEMAIFVLILVVGLAYVWAKGDLGWVKSLSSREAEDLESLSWYSTGRYSTDSHSIHRSAKPEGV
jgi:NADH-quinone oxidoreductase subunit A